MDKKTELQCGTNGQTLCYQACNVQSAASYREYKEKLRQYKAADAAKNMAADITLNAAEKRLDERMNRLREQMMNNKYVYAVRDASVQPLYYPPIHPFYDAKRHLLANKNAPEYKLFDLFSQMPKGGNLHIHTSATLSVEAFVQLLEEFDTGKFSDNGVHDWAVYVLQKNQDSAVKNTLYLADSHEQPIPVSAAYKRYSQLSSREKADLMSDLCFMDERKVTDTKYIWDAFNDCFSRVSAILNVRAFYFEYYVRSFKELIRDNIDYAEVRCGIPHFVDNNNSRFLPGQEDEQTAAEDYPFRLIYDAYQEAKRIRPDFTAKLIISGSRKKTPEIVKDEVKNVRSWMQTSPEDIPKNFIVGYDLVSEEDRGYKTDEYAEALYGSGCVGSVPFYFHDGESCWADDDNIYSAFTLGTRRIGHGLNLFRFPSMVDQMEKKGVALEVCPISNQLLRYTSDLRMHLIGEYINRGIPCVICSDDPMILGNPGLAYDFWEIYLGGLLGLREIKKLILNSYLYSGMTEEEKQLKINVWSLKWDRFVSGAAQATPDDV